MCHMHTYTLTHTHQHTPRTCIHTAAHPHATASGALQFQVGGRGGALVSPARRGFSNVESGGGPTDHVRHFSRCAETTRTQSFRWHAGSSLREPRLRTYLFTYLLAVLGSRELTVRALVRRRASLPLLSRLSEMGAWITGAR